MGRLKEVLSYLYKNIEPLIKDKYSTNGDFNDYKGYNREMDTLTGIRSKVKFVNKVIDIRSSSLDSQLLNLKLMLKRLPNDSPEMLCIKYMEEDIQALVSAIEPSE
jgi:hypothetical protein